MRKIVDDAGVEVVFYGGAIKALSENVIGGFIALFTTKKDPDLEKEFFTKATDFYLDEGARPRVLYHHGLDPELGKTKLGNATIKALDEGLWAEVDFSDEDPEVVKWGKAQIAKRKKYIGMVKKLAKAGQLGWSIGSAPHLVERKAHGDDVFEFTAFPAVEVSLSPVPIEPRTSALSIKAYGDELEEASDDREPALKAVWSTKLKNELPDSSFAYIEPGGKKDSEGKTTPRSSRHYPYKGADGAPDRAHVIDGLSRLSGDTTRDEATKARIRSKLVAAAKQLKIKVAEPASKSLGERLMQKIEDLVEDGADQEAIIKSMAREALVDVDRVKSVLSGESKIRRPELKAFCRILGVDRKVLERMTDTVPVTIKGMFEDALTEKQFRVYELWNTYCDVVAKLVNAQITAKLAGTEFDASAKIKEATAEYAARLQETVDSQVADYLESDYERSDARFYLRALADPRTEDFFESTRGVDIDDHLALVVSACESAEKRLAANGEARTKAGRELSQKNYDRFDTHFSTLEEHVKKGRTMLDGMRPSVSKAESEATRSEYMRSQHNAESILRDLELPEEQA